MAFFDDIGERVRHVAENCSGQLNRSSCYLTQAEKGITDAVAGVRLIISCLSILGATSIMASVILKKQVFSPKVHPIFVLSVADFMLALLWVAGGFLWYRQSQTTERVWCFAASLLTVTLECITVNLTLVYALFAYFNIRMKDIWVLDRSFDRTHGVRHPVTTVTVYIIAWVLPVIIVMIPFGIIAGQYRIVEHANTCSCWCIPIFGNVIPYALPGDAPTATFVHQMRKLILAYCCVLSVHYLVVFVLLVVVYYKILKRIKKIRKTHERTRAVHHYGAATILIVEGETRAKKRIIYFVTVFIINGLFNLILSFIILFHEAFKLSKEHDRLPEVRVTDPHLSPRTINSVVFAVFFLQSLTVPLQGLLNALVYGWTRDDFLHVMKTSGKVDNTKPEDVEIKDDEYPSDIADLSYSYTLSSAYVDPKQPEREEIQETELEDNLTD